MVDDITAFRLQPIESPCGDISAWGTDWNMAQKWAAEMGSLKEKAGEAGIKNIRRHAKTRENYS